MTSRTEEQHANSSFGTPRSYLEAFNERWSFGRGVEAPQLVTLPHDAMIGESRSPDAPSGSHGAYFHGGMYRYVRNWTTPADLDGRRVALQFQGVQGDCEVRVDGRLVGAHPSSYSEFAVSLPALEPASTHEITIDVDNRRLPSSRWYTGSGIYRPVSLRITDEICFDSDGVRVRTVDVSNSAEVAVDLHFSNPHQDGVLLVASLSFQGAVAAQSSVSTSERSATLSLVIEQPALWSADEPHLYDLTVSLSHQGQMQDRHDQRIGIRTLALDKEQGLLINGVPTTLRGGCVHHDNGIIGAATLAGAERRRVRILKDWGYNAVRSAHNPISRAFLDACDELGMYVLDEYTDSWYVHKVHHGPTGFAERWPDELSQMVAKDRNHPSVIMYSIGNEIPETGAPYGVRTAREMTQFLHGLDADRPITLGINPMITAGTAYGKDRRRQQPAMSDGTPLFSFVDSTAFNLAMSQVGGMMKAVGRTPLVDHATRDVFAELDVAGYNYGRYQMSKDVTRYPNRFLLGTETMPGEIAANWSLVESSPRVIGDFSWTAWDYLGEVGLGTWIPGRRLAPMAKPFPHIVAGVGAVDLIGTPGALAQLAKVTWGLSQDPLISVAPLDRSGQPVAKAAWRTTDAVPSWAWRGKEGVKAKVQVFSDADQVELRLNGRSLGKKNTGPRRSNVANFAVSYEAGELEAIAYRGGVSVGRSVLRSAEGELSVRVRAERTEMTADVMETVFVEIEIADDHGTVEQLADDDLVVTVNGPAYLVGLGSAAPTTSGSFADNQHSTYRGRALAAIRSTGAAGHVLIRVDSKRSGRDEVVIRAQVLQP